MPGPPGPRLSGTRAERVRDHHAIGLPTPHRADTRSDMRERTASRSSFTGAEEGDVLHAAGAWMNDHIGALLISVNWHGDFLSPYYEIDSVPGPPRHRLDLTVYRTGER